jgi:methyl-accepting chemotaxis protein
VVADEVRQLADESKRSADEIEEILSQLINMIDRINQGISQNNTIIHEQTMATQDIAGIVQNVRQVGISLIQSPKSLDKYIIIIKSYAQTPMRFFIKTSTFIWLFL